MPYPGVMEIQKIVRSPGKHAYPFLDFYDLIGTLDETFLSFSVCSGEASTVSRTNQFSLVLLMNFFPPLRALF